VKVLKYLFFPLGIIFGIIAEIRRYLYRSGILKSTNIEVQSIGIGNLSLGGTGKTPVSLFLINLLQKSNKIAFISRGYKRKSKGFIVATNQSCWNDLGDEPYLVKKKYPEIGVFVDGNRRRAVKKILLQENPPDLLIFDDVLQHLKIKTGLRILLTEYSQPFFSDSIFPLGRLREFKRNAVYSDFIIMTKCPSVLSPIERRHLELKIKKHSSSRVFFSSLNFCTLVPLMQFLGMEEKGILEKDQNISKELSTMGVCGIANPFSFEDYLRRNSNFISLMEFADHHVFSLEDIKKIKTGFEEIKSKRKIIVITEKDAVKLGDKHLIDEVKNLPMFVLPVEVKFDGKDQIEFENEIKKYVKKNQRIS